MDRTSLTTGVVAKICQVAPRTVSKWIDGGALKGHRVPMSKDRRVNRDDLREFMLKNGMPVEWLDRDAPAELPVVVGTKSDIYNALKGIADDTPFLVRGSGDELYKPMANLRDIYQYPTFDGPRWTTKKIEGVEPCKAIILE